MIEREHSKYLNGGPGKISPFFIPSAIVNLAAGNVSIRYGAKGPNSATATACSAGAHAVGDAYKIIQRCDAEVMIAGGSEAAITPMSIGGFGAMRALSTRNDEPERASRPFDAERDGFVVGEGSGMLILEALEFAERRGANIIAEIVGYGMSGDAYHITQPAEGGDGGYRVSLARRSKTPRLRRTTSATSTRTVLRLRWATRSRRPRSSASSATARRKFPSARRNP